MLGKTVQIIGVGQCGCRLGMTFEKQGIPALYINSDEVDFRDFNARPDQTLLIEGSGTGGSPSKGAELFRKHKSSIISFLRERLDKNKIIWVLWGSGGGTGNSIGPLLLEYLSEHKYVTGCITTLPPKMLDILATDNAMKTLKKLKDVNTRMTVLADNEYLVNKIGVGGDWWKKVNSHICSTILSAFDLLREGKTTQSGLGSIDKGEIMRIMQYGNGLTDVRVVYLSPYDFDLENKDLLKKLLEPSLIEGYNYKNTLAYLVGIDLPRQGNYTEISKKIFDSTRASFGNAISRLGMFVDPFLNDVIRVTMINAGLKLPKSLKVKMNNLKRDEARFIEKRNREETMDFSELEEGVLEEDFQL